MKAGYYVCVCIIILLIIIFLITRYYLVYNYTTIVTVSDGELLDILCLHDKHDIIIFYAVYRVNRGHQVNMTAALKAVLLNGQLEKNEWIFNAEDYNLPKNGKLTFRFRCDTCNGVNSGVNIITEEFDQGEAFAKQTKQKKVTFSKDSYEPQRIYPKYTPYVPEFPTSHRNADIIPILPGNSQSNIERDSYGVSSESAQYSNILTGIGKRDLIQRLTPSKFNYLSNDEIDISCMYNLDNLLTNLKESELTGDSPMSAVTNVFDRKYPQISLTSKLAQIDPEYLPNGLFNDAQGLNNLLDSSKGWGKNTSASFNPPFDSFTSSNLSSRRVLFTDGEIKRSE